MDNINEEMKRNLKKSSLHIKKIVETLVRLLTTYCTFSVGLMQSAVITVYIIIRSLNKQHIRIPWFI